MRVSKRTATMPDEWHKEKKKKNAKEENPASFKQAQRKKFTSCRLVRIYGVCVVLGWRPPVAGQLFPDGFAP